MKQFTRQFLFLSFIILISFPVISCNSNSGSGMEENSGSEENNDQKMARMRKKAEALKQKNATLEYKLGLEYRDLYLKHKQLGNRKKADSFYEKAYEQFSETILPQVEEDTPRWVRARYYIIDLDVREGDNERAKSQLDMLKHRWGDRFQKLKKIKNLDGNVWIQKYQDLAERVNK